MADLRRQSTRLLGGAQAVIAPCVDTARRIGRYIPAARVSVRPWEDDGAAAARVRPPRPRAVSGPARVCIAGAIGVLKGYRVLLACARDAARRRLELSFTVIGTTMNDAPLLATQHVFITGRFEDSEEDALIAGAQADLGWVPSVAPESWCYALTGLWRAGLWPVAFDLGAQSERIRAVEKGTILPLGLRAALINDVFLNVASGRAIA